MEDDVIVPALRNLLLRDCELWKARDAILVRDQGISDEYRANKAARVELEQIYEKTRETAAAHIRYVSSKSNNIGYEDAIRIHEYLSTWNRYLLAFKECRAEFAARNDILVRQLSQYLNDLPDQPEFAPAPTPAPVAFLSDNDRRIIADLKSQYDDKKEDLLALLIATSSIYENRIDVIKALALGRRIPSVNTRNTNYQLYKNELGIV